MASMKFFLAIFVVVAFNSCKPRSNADSELKHTFGKTSVPRKDPPSSCKSSGEDTPEGRYAKALVDYITSKNPETFSGNLDRKYICIQIIKTDDLNASMDPASGTMRFFKRILHSLPGLESDAAKAATVAHELAHFSMSHHLSNRDSAPPGYDRSKEQKLKAELDQAKKKLDEATFAQINDFFRQSNNEVSRAIQAVTTNTQFASKVRAMSFPKDLIAAHKNFINKPNLDNGESLLLEIDTWLVEADKFSGKSGSAISPDQAKLIKSVLARRETIREPNADLSRKLGEAHQKLDTHRLPILQFQEQEADEVGFEFYIRAGFDPDIYAQSFIHLAKAVRPSYECDEMTPLSPEPSRYREGVSFNKIHPDICWRYWDTKYVERRKHAADYRPFIAKNRIVNLPALDELRAQLP